MKLVNCPHVKHITSEIEAGPDGQVEVVMVIHTDIEIDPMHPHYEGTKLDALVAAAKQHVKENPSIAGRVRIRTI